MADILTTVTDDQFYVALELQADFTSALADEDIAVNISAQVDAHAELAAEEVFSAVLQASGGQANPYFPMGW